MTDDARLTDFAGDDRTDGDDGEPADGGVGAPDDPEPAAATAGWSPDGDACDACGRTVGRRWRDDGRSVCADCKDW